MSSITHIYALVDPRTREIRYIGKTQNIVLRIKGHLSEARNRKNRNCYKDNWIRQLLSLGLKPLISILKEVDSSKGECWRYWEKRLIKEARDNGCKLTNILEGGDITPINTSKIPENLLGTLPDKVLADQLGMTQVAISYRRRKLGIEPLPKYKEHTWTTEDINSLGRVFDARLAAKLYVEVSVVTNKRIELEIPAFAWSNNKVKKQPVEPRPKRVLPDYIISALGQKSDNYLAKQSGFSVSTIRKHRTDAGIPTFSENRKAGLTIESREVRKDKGQRRKPEKEKPAKKKPGAVSKIPLQLLGVLSDNEIASLTGLARETVKNARRKLKIKPASPMLAFEWDDSSIMLLGTMPDINLARKLNIVTSIVREKRVSLKIPHHKTNTICRK